MSDETKVTPDSVTFYVQGEPKGQPRPKAFARKFGNKWSARVYDPGTAENWKSLIAVAAAGIFKQPIQGPVSLTLNFWMPRPKAHYRSNGEVKDTAPRWHCSKPDSDNLEKAVMDALTHIGAWRDDSQVCQKRTHKQYTDAAPGCYVQIDQIVA